MAARRAWPTAEGGRPAAGKASGPGDQARPGGLKPRGAAAAAARCVPSRGQRSSRAAGDRSLSGAGDQAGGCSGLQGGDPRGGTGWYLHLGPAPVCHSVYPVRCPANAPERDVLRRSPPKLVRLFKSLVRHLPTNSPPAFSSKEVDEAAVGLKAMKISVSHAQKPLCWMNISKSMMLLLLA